MARNPLFELSIGLKDNEIMCSSTGSSLVDTFNKLKRDSDSRFKFFNSVSTEDEILNLDWRDDSSSHVNIIEKKKGFLRLWPSPYAITNNHLGWIYLPWSVSCVIFIARNSSGKSNFLSRASSRTLFEPSRIGKLEQMKKAPNQNAYLPKEACDEHQSVADDVAPYFHEVMGESWTCQAHGFERIKVVQFSVDSQTLSFSEVSDGVRQVFRVLAHFFYYKKNSDWVYFDEIENSLHPALVKRLFRSLFFLCNHFEKRLVIATHSLELFSVVDVFHCVFGLFGERLRKNAERKAKTKIEAEASLSMNIKCTPLSHENPFIMARSPCSVDPSLYFDLTGIAKTTIYCESQPNSRYSDEKVYQAIFSKNLAVKAVGSCKQVAHWVQIMNAQNHGNSFYGLIDHDRDIFIGNVNQNVYFLKVAEKENIFWSRDLLQCFKFPVSFQMYFLKKVKGSIKSERKKIIEQFIKKLIDLEMSTYSEKYLSHVSQKCQVVVELLQLLQVNDLLVENAFNGNPEKFATPLKTLIDFLRTIDNCDYDGLMEANSWLNCKDIFSCLVRSIREWRDSKRNPVRDDFPKPLFETKDNQLADVIFVEWVLNKAKEKTDFGNQLKRAVVSCLPNQLSTLVE